MKFTTPTDEDKRRTEADKATIDKYAEQLGATIHFDVPLHNTGAEDGPRANSARKVIHAVSLDKSPEAFWTTMHEMGHIAHHHHGNPFASVFGDPGLPESEAEAWAWALDHAGRPLDDAGKASIGFSLSSYIYSMGGMDVIGVGPNLRRMFTVVGPSLDMRLMRKIYPGDPSYSFQRARDLWKKAVSTNDLANAA